MIAAVLALVTERIRALLFVAPVQARLLTQLERCCEAGHLEAARLLVSSLPGTSACRVALAGLSGAADGLSAMQEELLEVRAWTTRRLRAVRVCATMASTLGLLGAIVSLVFGFGGSGLLSLQAGLAERVALDQALLAMGIGVGTSAFCFYAFGLLRRAAHETLAQAVRAARAVEEAIA